MRTVAKAITIILLLTAVPCWSQTQEENAAKAAEQAGKLREALNQYVTALQKASDGNSDDQRIREAVLRVVQRLRPSPAVPEEARRAFIRAQAAIKAATGASDFDEAAKELGRAVRIAPWWADAYYNQGIALEKAGKLGEAIRSFKLYVLAAPNSPEARKVQDQIYEIEYRQDKTQKDLAARSDEQERKRREEQAKAKVEAAIKAQASSLAGYWRDSGGSRYLFKVDGNSFTITRVMACWAVVAQPRSNCPDLRPDNTLFQFGTINNGLLSGHSVNTVNHRTRRVTYPDGRSFACPIAAGNYPITKSEISANGTQIKIIAEDTTQSPDCAPATWDHGRTYSRE